MADPPLEAGAVHEMAAVVADAVATATTPVGALAVVAGMAAGEAPDTGLVPAELAAVTVNV